MGTVQKHISVDSHVIPLSKNFSVLLILFTMYVVLTDCLLVLFACKHDRNECLFAIVHMKL
jgi:hypothetical protein